MNKKYSYRDFTNCQFKDVPAEDFSDSEIVGSCFYQLWTDGAKEETVVKDIFPKGIKNVTFSECNLDNVLVPESCLVVGGCNRIIQQQNDREDWILGEDLKPIEPIDKARLVKDQSNIDPKDIPATKITIAEKAAMLPEPDSMICIRADCTERVS